MEVCENGSGEVGGTVYGMRGGGDVRGGLPTRI